jgi:acyl carrier protein
MEISNFIEKFASQFDNTDFKVFKSDTEFRQLDNWSSVTALLIISMIDDEYEVIISGEDIVNSLTIQDLFDIVNTKKGY